MRSAATSRRCANASAAAGSWPWSRRTGTATAWSRRAGLSAPVLCLMAVGDPAEAIEQNIDVTAGSAFFAARVAAAARRAGVQARLHLEADTRMNRGGATREDWPELVA